MDVVVQAGAVVTFAGALALVWHGTVVQRERGPWTTDAGWHRFTSWSLLLAPAWFAVGVGIAGGPLPGAWRGSGGVGRRGRSRPALAIGWVGQVLVGSWSHLLPAIGPGDPLAHARQRSILGRWPRPPGSLALDGGAAVASIGVLTVDVPS